MQISRYRFAGWIAALLLATLAASPASARELLFGDTHLHTSNSFDAYLNRNNSADAETAYNYAKGLPVIHPYHRARVQIQTPLDFLVIADHAELLGVIRTVVEEEIPRDQLGWVDWVKAIGVEYWLRGVIEDDKGTEAFRSFLPEPQPVEDAAAIKLDTGIPATEAMSWSTWREAVATADLHNNPGTFTALIGWEWSSVPAGANLHRVVFTDSDATVAAKFLPFSSAISMYPEDLWTWLDETTATTGAEFVAIPHNSNISKGYMFGDGLLKSGAYTRAKAEQRMRLEPVAEATQIKGDSETHPDLSPDDAFADFELYSHYIQQDAPPYEASEGDYIRSALKRGMLIEEKIGFNPYAFGLIGSTDSHTSMASAEEPNFWGKLARDSVPENKAPSWRTGSDGGGPTGWSMAAQGLAAVWAEENTRTAILEAFRRREVYATTGPRLMVEVFADWQMPAHAAAGADTAVNDAVPMGGELTNAPLDAQPRFRVHALKDPKSANLDRVQIIKGWTRGGEAFEKVIDIAWSGERARGSDGKVPAVGNTVNPAAASYTNTIGAPELHATWSDPDFDPSAKAFYYIRVLEIPTPRHSTFDMVALGLDATEQDYPWWIQERAYTSPVWYRP
ncbi:MAG: DUF3604 domain-containing protein [Deltaproteobacteria bacterium]